ncbi:MAG: phosphatase PAP2 family protein [Pseudomonadota bacterium]
MPVPFPTNPDVTLEIWGPAERAALFQSDLISRLNFSTEELVADDPESRQVIVQHLQISSASCSLQPLVKVTRPRESVLSGQQLNLVAGYADLRGDRGPEILAQLGEPYPFISSVAFLDPSRTPRTLELLNAALGLAYFVVMQVKAGLACRRPHEYSSQIQPLIPAPLHGTLPSGHATESAIAAYVLSALLRRVVVDDGSGGTMPAPQFANDGWVVQLMRLASRIAVNRTIAGVHFPVDSIAGALLGLTLGQYLVARCTHDTGYASWAFEGDQMTSISDPIDHVWHDLFDVGTFILTDIPPYVTGPSNQTLGPDGRSAALNWIWRQALAEWR